jgi:hypothetical protein
MGTHDSTVTALRTEPAITRSQLISRGAKGGAALLVAGAALGRFAEAAHGEPLPDQDLAYARLLVAVELLSIDFYSRALEADRFGIPVRRKLREALAHEKAHYQSVAQILTGAGLTPAADGDIDFAYPGDAFDKRGSIAKLGFDLETISVGAYLGAVTGVQAKELVSQLARIAASEAQHLSAFGAALGRPFALAFPAPLPIDDVSEALDAYES